MSASTLTEPVCTECRSNNITVDANAAWDMDLQDWSLSATFDNAYCCTCEGECKLDWQEIKP
jgi:hypothetical protein